LGDQLGRIASRRLVHKIVKTSEVTLRSARLARLEASHCLRNLISAVTTDYNPIFRTRTGRPGRDDRRIVIGSDEKSIQERCYRLIARWRLCKRKNSLESFK
jgi:hypothetical protein